MSLIGELSCARTLDAAKAAMAMAPAMWRLIFPLSGGGRASLLQHFGNRKLIFDVSPAATATVVSQAVQSSARIESLIIPGGRRSVCNPLTSPWNFPLT